MTTTIHIISVLSALTGNVSCAFGGYCHLLGTHPVKAERRPQDRGTWGFSDELVATWATGGRMQGTRCY